MHNNVPAEPAADEPEAGAFTFIDLFAGIGGFHAALSAYGGHCRMASEIDPQARQVYESNWKMPVKGDINKLTPADGPIDVPEHDVLAAGFPCQSFSKSGRQEGFRDLTRGTLFFNICRVLEVHRPPVVLLENVRNLAGPRQQDTWNTIVDMLRGLGYNVSRTPAVMSPHLLPPELGGTPQVRERVFITGTYTGAPVPLDADFAPVVVNTPASRADGTAWVPTVDWNLAEHLPLEYDPQLAHYYLSPAEERWIACWDDFLKVVDEPKLPGFPIWADDLRYHLRLPDGYTTWDEVPDWKYDFLVKNRDLYRRNRVAITKWKKRWDGLAWMPPSRRKLEWQAQDTARSLKNCVLHFRPSGIRAKRGTYLPALVAITQTSVLGQRGRRITPVEAARLQGLPDWFGFGTQTDAATYKQLGNGVAVGVVYHVLRKHVERDRALLEETAMHVVKAVLDAPAAPLVPQPGHPAPRLDDLSDFDPPPPAVVDLDAIVSGAA